MDWLIPALVVVFVFAAVGLFWHRRKRAAPDVSTERGGGTR